MSSRATNGNVTKMVEHDPGNREDELDSRSVQGRTEQALATEEQHEDEARDHR